MVGEIVGHAANEVVEVCGLGVQRQRFADVHSRDVRRNRPELAPIIQRCLGLHVVRFHGGRTTRQPDENDRVIRLPRVDRPLRLQPQKVRQSQSSQGQ